MYPRFKYISNIKSPQGPWDGLHAPKLNSARPGLANTAPADVPDIEPARLGLACSKTPHLPTFPTSSPLGSAGALEMAARARSARLGPSKWTLEGKLENY